MSNTAQQVQQAYLAYFGRPADVVGLNYWEGQTPAAMTAGFTGSVEFASLYTGMSAAQQVNQVYLNVLGRAAEPAALTYWGGVLTSGVSISALVSTIYNTVLAESTTSTDYVTVANRVAYATQFTNAMSNSSPDILGYSGTVASNAARTALANAVPSSSTSTTTFPTLATDVTTVAGAGAAAAATTAVNLTTSVDTITPAGPATINGVISSTVGYSTLNAFDSIKATGTGNTLNIVDQTTVGTLSTIPTITVSGVQTADIQSTTAESVNTSSWTGLTALNITASTASGAIADAVTAAGTTAVAVTETAGASTGTTTIDGGSTVNLTETANDGATVTKLGGITIGGTTAPTGAVTVTDTVTLGAASSQGYITVTGGGPVTISSTVNSAVALTANAGAVQTDGIAGIITVKAAVGAVVINDATNSTDTGTAVTTTADAVSVTGGSSVTVNETATATQSAAHVSTIAEGAVSVTGDATTTSVTVNQAAVATGALASAAVTAVAGVAAVTAVAAAPGVQGVTGVTAVTGVAAAAAVVGTPTITADGVVTIADANAATATTASNTITAVTLNNYAASSTIADNALTTLTLSGTAGTLGITNAAAAVATNTTLALNVNNLSGTNTITDVNNEIKVLNVTTGAKASTLAAFADTGLTKLNVAGASTLTLGTINGSLTAIAVSGAAGFNDSGTTAANGFAALGAAATLTTTSSGVITASINDTTQTFVGSTGQDIITISDLADATKVVTGGSGTTDKLILEGGAYALTAATAAKVTGFETLAVAANVTGTIDTSVLGAFTGLETIGTGTIAFTKVGANASLTVDASNTAVSVTYADATGTSDITALTLGQASNKAAITSGSITLADANGVGVGTVNLVSNDSTAAAVNTITTLVDNGLSVLNVSGNAGLTIGTLNEATTQATSFTLNNTETGTATTGVTITAFTDANLGTLNFTGTGNSFITGMADSGAVLGIAHTGTGSATIGTLTDTNLTNLNFSGANAADIGILVDATATTLTIANTGTGLLTVGDTGVGDFVGANTALTSLTLTGQVAVGLAAVTAMTPTGATTGFTLSGASDNAHVNFALSGAASGNTDTIKLGNGNDHIVDGSIAGTVNATVGTGSNLIVLGGSTTNTTGAFNITLGAHTLASGPDQINVGTGGTAYATVANYVVTGAVTGDVINFAADAASLATALTATSTAAAATVASAIGLIETALGAVAHTVAYGVYGGNTYIAETLTGTHAATDTTIVEIVGSHTLTAAAGYVTLAS